MPSSVAGTLIIRFCRATVCHKRGASSSVPCVSWASRGETSRLPVSDLHHVHVWEVNAGHRILSAHVRLAEAETLLERIHEDLAHA
jgi:Co/Zn/Cd efflux system component